MRNDGTNLLAETLAILQNINKAPNDVRWVGVRERGWLNKRKPISFSWEQFAAVADFTYDSGYGGNEVAGSLVVVGDDWWLERGEYDGSEWWEFKTLPTKPEAGNPEQADLRND